MGINNVSPKYSFKEDKFLKHNPGKDRKRLLWMWVKSDYINMREFGKLTELIDKVEYYPEEDDW